MITKKEFIESNLNRTIRWLEFAEAKIGALIAFQVTMVVAGVSLFSKIKNFRSYFIFYIDIISFWLMLIFFLLSTILLITSILPQLYISNVVEKFFYRISFENKKKEKVENIIFFGYIATLSEKEYKDILRQKLSIKNWKNIDELYLNQIWINSRIVYKKMKCFNVASIMTIIYLVLGVLSFYMLSYTPDNLSSKILLEPFIFQ